MSATMTGDGISFMDIFLRYYDAGIDTRQAMHDACYASMRHR